MKKLTIVNLQKAIQKLINKNIDFIKVSNTEWYSLFKDEIRNSIAIEGVFANRSELLDVLEKNKRTNKQKTAAILGYFESASAMYEYAYNQFKEKEFTLRIADLKQIHTLLMRYEKDFGFYTGDIGEFRKGNVEVALATFKPINGFYVREAIALFIKWFNAKLKDSEFDRLKLAAISHIWFETIHPFRDGNGRVGRILLSYLLIGCGLVNISIKGIAKSDREKYYKALETSDECFEKINREIEKEKKVSIQKVNQYINKNDSSLIENIIIDCLSKSATRLQANQELSLEKDAKIPLQELAVAYNYSQNYLRNLINRGNLKATKRGKLWYVRVRDMLKYIKNKK